MEKFDFLSLAKEAAKIADDKKSENVVILDVRDLTAIANYFVIAAADSAPQINAICGEIEKKFKEKGIPIVRREGIDSGSWRVTDYGGLIIHVMSPSVRETYNLEKLWKDAKTVKTGIAEILKVKPSGKIKEYAEVLSEIVKKEKKAAAGSAEKISETASKKISAAKKSVEKGIKTAGDKVKKAKRTVRAVGKGIEAFGKALVKKSPAKKSVKSKAK
ncbi:MAG: ribosome silencing factor [Endomicrobium sp.]|jgi:ribosome-associated protein|nr:ribosome silencing factor [Endomicrobium sp.]